ncbi:30S ribosomal protein S6 [Parvularcula oceani]|uniref:30S ribosomal protein S6 n=1 Tax=Parvularcula oceani TaxID=1247963 RepID=UPI0004E139F8|nr:30S ribosomal protein S6 [Parvularcula oceani]
MPLYEHVYIARQDVSPAQVEHLTEELQEIIREHGGSIEKSEYWGLRNLQYKINKNRKGHYSLMNITAPAEAIQEMERQMRIKEDILRFMTLRVEEHDEEPSPVMSRRDRDESRRRDRDRS